MVSEGVAQLVLAVVEAYVLGYVATTKRAVLQGVAAHLTTADMTTGQEDDLRLEEQKDKTQSVMLIKNGKI